MQNLFSNCAGNPDCNCGKTFSNCSGCAMRFSNCCGSSSHFNNAVGLSVDVEGGLETFQTLTQPTSDVAMQKTTGQKVVSTLSDLAGLAGGLFGKKEADPVATTQLTDEKKVPTMVWVALGILVVLLAVFLVIKLRKS